MNGNLVNELATFRSSWLRAIAFTWTNKEFKHELLHPPKGEDALDVIAKAFPSLKDSQLGEAITLSVHDDPQFVWIGDGWSWVPAEESQRSTPYHKSEGLTLRIPLEAPVVDAKQCAAALTDYYAIRPQLFAPVDRPRDGHLPHIADSEPADRPQPSVADRIRHSRSPIVALARSLTPLFSGQRIFSELTPQNGHLMYGAVTFREFEIALTVVMARAWQNDEFRKLIQGPEVFREALRYAHGYTPPWLLRLDVKHDDKAEWSPRSRWTNLRRHELTLSLPQPPDRGDRGKPEDWSVALAAYNAEGAQYPFSCCGLAEVSTPSDSDRGSDLNRR